MNRKNALLISMAVCGTALTQAQPAVMEQAGTGFFDRGMLMQDVRNYIGSTHQLFHFNNYLEPVWSQDVEADYAMVLNEFELGKPGSLTMLEEFIDNYAHEPLAVAARAKVGDYYFYRGEYAQALDSYEQVRDKALDDDAAETVLYHKAFSNLMLENYAQAKVLYDKLSTTKQYSSASTFYNAYINYANGDYDKAYDLFSSVNMQGELGYQAQYYMCQILYKQNSFNEAVRLGESLIDDNQNDYFAAEINRIVGESYYRMGNNSAAEPYLARFVELADEENTARRPAAYMLGVINYNNRDFDKAVANMATVTDVDDALAQSALLYIGQSRLKTADYNGAAMAFERAAGMRYDDNVRETAFYNYAISQSQGGRTPFNKSIDMFEQFLNEYPRSTYYGNVENYLIDAYTTTGDYDKALESIARINNPSDKVLKAKQTVLYHKGVQQLRNNKPADAASSLQQAVSQGEKDKEIYNNSKLWLAEAQYQLGDYSAAARNQQDFVNSVSSNDANYGLAQYNLGSSLFNKQDYTGAITAFKKAIDSNSLSGDMVADAYNRMGDAQYYGKNFDDAIASYSKAAVGNSDSQAEYAMLRKAIIAGDKNQYQSKIDQLNELIRTYPSSSKVPEAMLEKGNAQVAAGQLSDAVNTYTSLVNKYPEQPEAREALLRMALTQRQDNDNSNAVDNYWKVIELYPASSEARTAAQDLKTIYAERGELASFSNRLNAIDGGPRIDVKEVEKATFDAAETYYIDNSRISKLENYLIDFPNGAYVGEAKYYIGHYYYSKGDYNSAMHALDDAIDGNEDAAFAQRALALKGAILLDQGQGEEAYDIYNTWATKATNDDNMALAQLGMLRAARTSQQWERVVENADNLLNGRQTLSSEVEQEVVLARALANANMGETDLAMTDMQRLAANTQSEAGAQAAYELGKLQYAEGDLQGAERTIDALVDSDTQHFYWVAKGLILLCDVYYDQGNKQKALEYLTSLKINYPGKEGEIFNEIETRLNQWQKKSKK